MRQICFGFTTHTVLIDYAPQQFFPEVGRIEDPNKLDEPDPDPNGFLNRPLLFWPTEVHPV